MDEYGVPAHIRAHCTMVAKTAVFLGSRIDNVNVSLIKTAGLLHDLVRIVDIHHFTSENQHEMDQWNALRKKYPGMLHEELGSRILEERGEHEVAECIKKHRFLAILEESYTTEQSIVYYADKRVKHDTITTLRDRFEDGERRHGKHRTPEENEIAERARQKVYALEKELCSMAHITADDITQESVLATDLRD